MTSLDYHLPVLLEESLHWLRPAPGARVVDGTVGGGGHAVGLLERVGPEGMLVGIDRDAEALAATRRRLEERGLLSDRVHLLQGSFREMDSLLAALGIESVDGVLLDLGVSSFQLDTPRRGFRFAEHEGESAPLDMRMDASRGETAAALLARATEEELRDWLRRYGELREAGRLARAIVSARAESPVETRRDLVELIRATGVGRGRRHDPATRVFQALRIAVNDELGALEEGLGAALTVLRPGGRLVVLSYHSLEDRIVKQRFRAEARGCICPPEWPACTCGRRPGVRILTKRPVGASEEEVARNPRARSVRLRAAERLEAAA